MQVTRLAKTNHYEEITRQIRTLIASGSLPVGSKLPSTKQMAEQFGVGRSTMREALSALKAMGLIEIRQGGACRVIADATSVLELPEASAIRDNRTLLVELLEVRLALESETAALAAERRGEAELAALQEIVQAMAAALADDEEGERLDLTFHQMLARMTGNAMLMQMFDSIVKHMVSAIRHIRRAEIYADASVAGELYRQHEAITAAIAARDGLQAAALMRGHLQHVRSMLDKYI